MKNMSRNVDQITSIDPRATQSTLQNLAQSVAETGKAEAAGQSSVYVQGLKNLGEALSQADSADERREYVQATERMVAASSDGSEKRTWLTYLTIRNLSAAAVLTGSVAGVVFFTRRLR